MTTSVPIRQLLDDLDGPAINRLCELRGLSRRGLDARREALARSYGGEHELLFEDLRKEDLVVLLGQNETEIDGALYCLPRATRYARDELIRIARDAFCSDGIPSEFIALEGDGEDADDGSSEDDEDEDDFEGEDEEDETASHTSSEHEEWLLQQLTYDPDEAAAKQAHPYQRDAEATLLRSLGEQPLLLHIATGGGKTLVANNVLFRWLEGRGGPVLWVTKDWRLLFQAAQDLRRRHRVPMPMRLGGDGRVLHPLAEAERKPQGIVYTTIHTLARRLARKELTRISPTLLIWDECHWGEHSGTGKILTACSRKGIPVLGLTGTPRHDTRYNVAFRRTYRELVTDGYLAKEIVHHVATGTVWSPDVQSRFGDVTQASLKELAKDRRRNDLIVKQFLDHQQRYEKTIVFACTVEHATRLAELFVAKGIAARPIHYHQDEGAIHRDLDMFRTGQVDVLINVAMLTHGIDVPDAKTVFLCRPTTSDILFAQMIGRACRRHEESGKTSFNVVEFTDNVQTHRDVLKTAKEFFQGAGSGRPDETPRSRPVSGTRPLKHAFDPTGEPTWMPDDAPESHRSLWYRQHQTFGVEIELTVEGSVPTTADREWHRIAEELRLRLSHALLGRVAPKVTAEYQGSAGDKDTSVWNVEFDSSTGWEVTSRILSDYNGFTEVDDVCRVLDGAATELGLVVNHRTGLHVHIGWLGRDVEELKRAVRLAKLFEPALGTLVGPSRIAHFEGGKYDLSSPNIFCAPISTLFSERVLDGLHSVDDFAWLVSNHKSRYVTFNIKPLQSIHTVEIRMHSGTLEARKILPWLSLWMQILWVASTPLEFTGGSDRPVIEPKGDIVALARRYLPQAKHPKQEAFIQRLAARRSEVVQQWARHPQLRPWMEHAARWASVPT